MPMVQATKFHEAKGVSNDAIDILLTKLDEAIDDMENGRVQTLDDAWVEIDRI